MSTPFVCPFCEAVSHLPRDMEEQYCGRCHVFVNDVLVASPTVRRVMARFLRRLADRHPESAAVNLKAADIWEPKP